MSRDWMTDFNGNPAWSQPREIAVIHLLL